MQQWANMPHVPFKVSTAQACVLSTLASHHSQCEPLPTTEASFLAKLVGALPSCSLDVYVCTGRVLGAVSRDPPAPHPPLGSSEQPRGSLELLFRWLLRINLYNFSKLQKLVCIRYMVRCMCMRSCVCIHAYIGHMLISVTSLPFAFCSCFLRYGSL